MNDAFERPSEITAVLKVYVGVFASLPCVLGGNRIGQIGVKY